MRKIKCLTIYLYAMFLLLCNASVFFGVKFGNQIAVLFIIISVILAFIKHRIPMINIKKCAIVVVFFLLSNLMNYRSGVNWVSALLFIGELVAISIVQSFINVKELHKAIVKCMLLISLVSLFTFFISEMNVSVLEPFITRETIHGSGYVYIYTLWHTFGWNVFFHRNAGPYWEAGMYACYLTIALCMLEFEENIFTDERKRKIAEIILIGTLFTTFSTTGYLSIILYSILRFVCIPNSGKKNILKKVALGVVVIGIGYIVLNTSVVQDKLFTSNSSRTKRIEDIIGGFKLIKESPVFGLGFRSELSRHLEIVYGSGNSANGLIQGCYRMGTLVFGILLCLYYKGLTYVVGKKNAWRFFMFLVFLFACEPIQIFLMMLSFIFINESTQRQHIYDRKVLKC